MPKAISAERWAAARALMRLEAPIQTRIAAAMGVNPRTLAEKMAIGDWQVLDWRRQDIVAAHEELRERLIDRFVRGVVDAPVAVETQVIDAVNAIEISPEVTAPDGMVPDLEMGRAARVSAMLVKHADKLLTQMEVQGGLLSKPQLDAMLAMVRLAEKFEPLAQKEAAEQQEKSDDEIAGIYEFLDRRIDEIARVYAAELVARGDAG